MKTQGALSRSGYTLVELLVTVLILSMLVAVALISYVETEVKSRLNTSNSNAQTLATAIKAAGIVEGTLPSAPLTDSTTLANLGGTIPANPCNNDLVGNNANDWTVNVISSTQETVTAVVASGMDCGTPTTYTISL